MTLRVAVIGAGAGGLCALRHLAARPALFTPVAYEQSTKLGGTWVYTDRVDKDESGRAIHCSMYKNLRTNLPKEVMAFPDFPFSKDLPSFMTHQDVRHYLEEYAAHFNLSQYIQFQTGVEYVHPKTANGQIKWQVSTTKYQTEPPSDSTDEFDAVIVCNGHYSIPLIPLLPGLSSFKGRVVHSHNYRDPKEFAGEIVLCLGAGASGQDIAMDMLSHAKQVYLCHRHAPLQTPLPPGMHQKPGVHRVYADKVELEGGEIVSIDAILFCTGYRYTFPFLSPDCGLSVDQEERVTPLWKHVIHPNLPSLSIIGVPKKICPFPLFDCQVQLVLRTLAGDVTLPTSSTMLADEQEEFAERLQSGMPERYAHNMGPRQWSYNDDLAHIGRFKPIPPVVSKLYSYVHECRATDLPNYKRRQFELTGHDTFTDIEARVNS